ncbi:MAG: hypothetical protein HYU43_05660, partial [Armatimonadetes bacterium]|nr:hypothetical protein [Armatimonadota bacterium]
YQLLTADKQAMACLASRFPYGSEITRGKLGQVERIEEFLEHRGFRVFRARHHGDVLRLELGRREMEEITRDEVRRAVSAFAKEQGFVYVTLDLDGINIPQALIQQVTSRVAALSTEHRALLTSLAVHDAPIDLATWQALCGPAILETALPSLLTDHWIHRTPDAKAYEFTDPLVAATLHQGLSDTERSAWHAHIVQVLRTLQAPAHQVDRHLAYSDDPEATAALLRCCAHDTAMGNITGAIRRLSDQLERSPTAPQRSLLLATLARYQFQTDQLTASRHTVEQWLHNVPPRSPAQYEAFELLASIHLRQGQWEDAMDVLTSAQAAAQHDHLWSIRFTNTMAKWHMLQGDYAEALTRYAATWRAACALPHPQQQQIPNNERSQCHWLLGDIEAAVTCAREELAVLPETMPLQIAIRRYVLARALYQTEQVEGAHLEYEQAIAAARQAQDLRLLVTLYHGFGNLLMNRQQADNAIPYFERAVPLCYRIGDMIMALSVQINLGHSFLQCDQIERAEHVLRAARLTLDRGRGIHRPALVQRCTVEQLLGDCARRRRAWDTAVQHLDTAWALATQHALADRRFS